MGRLDCAKTCRPPRFEVRSLRRFQIHQRSFERQLFVLGLMPLRIERAYFLVVTLLLVPTLLVAVIKVIACFREQARDSVLSVIRNLLPLAITAFLSVFCWEAPFALSWTARQQMGTFFRETHEAIEKIQPGAAKLDAAHPLQLTVEDLAKASPLSERTRLWLANSSITVAPDKPHPGPYCCWGHMRFI